MNQDRYATNKWNERNRNRNMALTEARQQQLLNGCNSLERKIFDHVPIQEPWDAKEINRVFHAAGNSAEHHRLRAALGGLKDKGLVREMKRDHFQRTDVKIRELREPIERERPAIPKLGDGIDVNMLRRAVVNHPATDSRIDDAKPSRLSVAVAVSTNTDHLIERAQTDAKNSQITEVAEAVAVIEQTVEKAKETQGEVQMAQAQAVASVEENTVDPIVQLAALADTALKISLASKNKLQQLSSLAVQIAEETDDQLLALGEKIEELAQMLEEQKQVDAKQMKKFRQWKALMHSLSEDD